MAGTGQPSHAGADSRSTKKKGWTEASTKEKTELAQRAEARAVEQPEQAQSTAEKGEMGRTRARTRVRVVILALAAGILAGSATTKAALGCTVDEVLQRAYDPRTVMLRTVEILTGKTWKDLDEKTQRELVKIPAATHYTNMYGEVEEIGYGPSLASTHLPSGTYLVSVNGKTGDYLETTSGGVELWLKESYGCWGTYYDVFVWRGYTGKLCRKREYEDRGGSC